jgi:uncharacterized protein YcbX
VQQPSQARPAGTVATIHRYPVKSVLGETLDQVALDCRGLDGDRLWSVRDPDGKLGSGKSTRRFRRMDGLLRLAARYDGQTPVIEFPDGRLLRGDDPEVHAALSAHVGRPVTLARESDVSHFDGGPVHLVTTSALRFIENAHGGAVDPRRLRPNLVVATDDGPGMVEETWVGRRVAVGSQVVLQVTTPVPRCVMLNLPQNGLAGDPFLLDTVTAVNDMNLGVIADVLSPGIARTGDPVRLIG